MAAAGVDNPFGIRCAGNLVDRCPLISQDVRGEEFLGKGAQTGVQQRSGIISESVQLVPLGSVETITMRIEYLAAIAIAAVAAGTGLAVRSLSARGSPKKRFTPAAAQLATLSLNPWIRFCFDPVGRSPRATIPNSLTARRTRRACNSFASHHIALASIHPFLGLSDWTRDSPRSAYAATSRRVLPML